MNKEGEMENIENELKDFQDQLATASTGQAIKAQTIFLVNILGCLTKIVTLLEEKKNA